MHTCKWGAAVRPVDLSSGGGSLTGHARRQVRPTGRCQNTNNGPICIPLWDCSAAACSSRAPQEHAAGVQATFQLDPAPPADAERRGHLSRCSAKVVVETPRKFPVRPCLRRCVCPLAVSVSAGFRAPKQSSAPHHANSRGLASRGWMQLRQCAKLPISSLCVCVRAPLPVLYCSIVSQCKLERLQLLLPISIAAPTRARAPCLACTDRPAPERRCFL